MVDMFKIKRLFSLKPALIVMAFFMVFNLGKMNPSAPCLNPENVQESMGNQNSIVVPRQVKSEQTKDSITRLDAILEKENRHNVHFAYKDSYSANNDPVEIFRPSGKQIYEAEKTTKEVKTPKPEVKKPNPVSKPVEAFIDHKAEKKPAPSSHDAAAKPPSTNTGPKTPPAKPVDYYGTGSYGHHVGLKRMGYSSISKHSYKSLFITDPHIYNRDTIRKPPGQRKTKLIACFNCPQRFFLSNKHNNDFKKCPYSECELSTASGMNPKADMMLFWQDPEVDHPPPRPEGQLWTFVSWEAPPNRAYPRPVKNWHDVFNYTMSYLRDADFYLPYDSLVWRDEDLLHSDEYYIEAAKRKTKTAAWWVSHCNTKSKRRAYVDEMKKYIPDLDVYGSCGNLNCPSSHSDDCWKSLNTTYRFYLAFENTFCPEYVTEKFYKTFRYRYPVIPVVRGGFEYKKYFPKDILINAADFANAKDLANYLIQLSKDPVKLGKMYKEKDRFGMLNRKMDWCDFCEKLHTGGLKKQVIHDVMQYSHSRPCWDAPNDIK